MKSIVIGEASRLYGVSTRTLRYYEQIGILQSAKEGDGGYRHYDGQSLVRLRRILWLRRMRIPLKEIELLLKTQDAEKAVGLLQRRAEGVGDEIRDLRAIQTMLRALIRRLETEGPRALAEPPETDAAESAAERPSIQAPDASPQAAAARKEAEPDPESRAAPSLRSEEEAISMEEKIPKLNDVRILYVPPCTVAASHYIGEEPETHAAEIRDAFVRQARLWEVKPDARCFGFNHPNPSPDRPVYGYEFWVTIPEDMEVPAPLVKKTFPGGLFAAHTIQFPNFHEWQWLYRWVEESKFEFCWAPEGEEVMGGGLEEAINYLYNLRRGLPEDGVYNQLDLLLPIRTE